MESLVIRLYKVYTMLMPGLESQSPEWTSTVSTIMRRCGDDDEETVRMRGSVMVNTKNGEEPQDPSRDKPHKKSMDEVITKKERIKAEGRKK